MNGVRAKVLAGWCENRAWDRVLVVLGLDVVEGGRSDVEIG